MWNFFPFFFPPMLKICTETVKCGLSYLDKKHWRIFSTNPLWTLFFCTSHSANMVLNGTEYVKALSKSRKKILYFLKICKQCLDMNKNIPINGTFVPIPRDRIQHYASLNPYSGISALHSLTQEIRNDFGFSWSQVPIPIRLFFVTSERNTYIYNNIIYFYLLPDSLWPFWTGFSSVSSPILLGFEILFLSASSPQHQTGPRTQFTCPSSQTLTITCLTHSSQGIFHLNFWFHS